MFLDCTVDQVGCSLTVDQVECSLTVDQVVCSMTEDPVGCSLTVLQISGMLLDCRSVECSLTASQWDIP